MPTLLWRGDAQPVRQVTTLTPANVEIGDTFTVLCNRKTISFTATAPTVANVVSGLVGALVANAQDIPEFDEITATAGSTTSGGVTTANTHVILTGPTDGKPFTVTTSTGDAGTFGVTVTTLTNGSAAVNEVQRVVLAGPPTGGTFTLTFDGQTTGNIAYNANAATITTALEALSNIGVGDVTVTGTGVDFTVEFVATYAATDVPLLTGNGTNLTGGAAVDVATTVPGAAGANEVQRITYNGTIAVNWRVSFNGATTAYIAADPSAATVQSALEALATIGAGNVSVVKTFTIADAFHRYDVTFIGALGATNVIQMAVVTGPLTITTVTQGSGAAANEVQTLTVKNAPTAGTWTATFSGQTTAAQAFNESAANLQTDLEALSTIGAGNIAVARAGAGTLVSPYVYTCTFQGTLANTDVAQMTASGASLTGSAVSVSTTQTAAAAVNEQQQVELTGGATGGNFTLTFGANTTANIAYNAAASAVDSALELLASIGAGNVSVIGAAGGPWVVTFTGALAATNVAAMTGTDVDLVAGGSQTLTANTTTTPTGPHHFDDAENWTNNSVPTTGDVVIFENSDVDCLYGLTTQAAQTLAELRVMQSYTGKIGLPTWTGLYYEYRSQYLAMPATLVNIGQGDGSGSGRVKLDTGSVQTALAVLNSGTPEDTELSAVLWKGTHASNAVRVLRGSLGAAVLGGEVATMLTLDVGYVTDIEGDSNVWVGRGVTLGTVTQSGGTLLVDCAVATSHSMTAGEATLDGTGAIAQLNVRGGSCFYNTSGTLGGATVVCGAGVLDFTRDNRAKTVTNPIEVFGDEARVRDTFKVVGTLIIDGNNIRGDLSQFEIGPNVRLTRGVPS